MAMMSFTITIRDDSRIMDVMELMPTLAVESIDAALNIVGPDMLQALKDATPVGETGELREGWVMINVDKGLLFRNDVEHATWVEEGTGIFGPIGQMITPTNAKKLRFVARDGATVFTKAVKGQRPQPFIDEAWDEDEVVDDIADLVIQGLFGDI